MNIVQLQDQLKNFSQDQLVREMQMPSGNAPQFLVLGEIMRRQKMQQDFTAQQAKGDQGTVAQEAVAAAGVPQGGIADMARAMAPSTDMTQNTGVQAMYAGGPVKKMAKGDKVETDPAVIAMANRAGMSVNKYLESLGEEEAARVVAGAEQRAARNRMMAMEPIGEGITFPTQADLDRSFQEEQFAFDASRPLVAPTAIDMPTVPLMQGQVIGAPAAGLPSIAGAPAMPPMAAADAAPASPPSPLPATGPYSMVPSALMLAEEERLRTEMGIPGGEGFDERAAGASTVPEDAPITRGPKSNRQLAYEEARAAEEATPSPAFEQQGREQSPTTLEEAIAAQEAAAAAAAAQGGGGDGAGGGGAGGGGAGGMSSYEQELMDALGRREKAAEQDKWLALAQVGLNLMSSRQPTLGGALGEAGLKGVEAARGARDQYDKDRLELLGALEQSRAARAKAAAGGGGLTAYQAATLGRYARQDAVSMLGTLYDRLGTLAPTGVPLPQNVGDYERTKAQIAGLENELYGGGAEAESGEAIDVRTKT
jgi:hypothetical protein